MENRLNENDIRHIKEIARGVMSEELKAIKQDTGDIKTSIDEIKESYVDTLTIIRMHGQTLYGAKNENGLVGKYKHMKHWFWSLLGTLIITILTIIFINIYGG